MNGTPAEIIIPLTGLVLKQISLGLTITESDYKSSVQKLLFLTHPNTIRFIRDAIQEIWHVQTLTIIRTGVGGGGV